jgi:hypothetical protein
LIGYAWVIAFRELVRTPRIPVEIRRGSVILAGLLTSPFVISAFAWWVLTGKRLPGPFGARLPTGRRQQSGIGSPDASLAARSPSGRSSRRSGSDLERKGFVIRARSKLMGCGVAMLVVVSMASSPL